MTSKHSLGEIYMAFFFSIVGQVNLLCSLLTSGIRPLLAAICILLICNSNGIIGDCVKDYDLPITPKNLIAEAAVDPIYGKQIPRNIWIAVKNKNDELPGHLRPFFERNSLWKKNICDNICKDSFMNEVALPHQHILHLSVFSILYISEYVYVVDFCKHQRLMGIQFN